MNTTKLWDLKRLLACLAAGVVLAVMYGTQEGSQTDLGISFREAIGIANGGFPLRLLVFLGVGLVLYVLVTFWGGISRYIHRPGALPLGIGTIVVLASQVLMNWYDPSTAKFKNIANATGGLAPLAAAFFTWLAWALLVLSLVGALLAMALNVRVLGYVVAVIGLVSAVLVYYSHQMVINLYGGIDHSLGHYTDLVGFLIIAGAGATIARSTREVADTRGFINQVMAWRPGMPVAVLGLILGLLGLGTAAWFAPLELSATLSDTSNLLGNNGLAPLGKAYLSWLAWALFAVTIVVTLVGVYLRNRMINLVAIVLGVAGLVITLLAMKSITDLGAQVGAQYGRKWQNLGAGPWLACIAFSFAASAAYIAATAGRIPKRSRKNGLPVSELSDRFKSTSSTKTILLVAVAAALFYPQTLTVTWQNVIVTQIGVYILLTIGLNVVIGWAGLLDLGYIAFYGIGSYTTAYFTGSLPLKPPWGAISPLWAIPFAIIACLIAGVILGAPTLRLRGDYLAIVTLGFGEIIQIIAINNPGNITGGPQGPTVPHPKIHIGPIKLTWGLDNMPYWYLLLVFIVVVVVLFYKLEGSRLGRAWAAIREDEVAAQATGVNTTKAKLLAFAIGATTSGVAGVFFASQVGYFDPSQFTILNSILIVAYVVFGGMGSLPGAIAGAAVLTWLPQFLKDQVPSADRYMWIGAIVLAMMIFRPQGLIPAKRRAAELEIESGEGAVGDSTVVGEGAR